MEAFLLFNSFPISSFVVASTAKVMIVYWDGDVSSVLAVVRQYCTSMITSKPFAIWCDWYLREGNDWTDFERFKRKRNLAFIFYRPNFKSFNHTNWHQSWSWCDVFLFNVISIKEKENPMPLLFDWEIELRFHSFVLADFRYVLIIFHMQKRAIVFLKSRSYS